MRSPGCFSVVEVQRPRKGESTRTRAIIQGVIQGDQGRIIETCLESLAFHFAALSDPSSLRHLANVFRPQKCLSFNSGLQAHTENDYSLCLSPNGLISFLTLVNSPIFENVDAAVVE